MSKLENSISVHIPYSLTLLMNTTSKTIAVLTVVLSMITAVAAINFHSTAFAQSGFNAELSG